jgi:hypothetical protein
MMPAYIWFRDSGDIIIGQCVDRQDAIDHCKREHGVRHSGDFFPPGDHHFVEPEFFVVHEPDGISVRQLFQRSLAALRRAA